LEGQITIGERGQAPRECSGEANAGCFLNGMVAGRTKKAAGKITLHEPLKSPEKPKSLAVVLEPLRKREVGGEVKFSIEGGSSKFAPLGVS